MFAILSQFMLLISALFVLVSCGSDAPTISGIEPAIGLMQGGEKITLRGGGFDTVQGTTVYFGDHRVKRLGVAPSGEIWVNTPSVDRPGKVDVRVVVADGTQFVIPNGFEFMKRDKMAECVNISKQLNGTFDDAPSE